MCALENRINDQIRLMIGLWLLEKKLSLNFTKTNFIIINKHPKKSALDLFTIKINDTKITRVYKSNYLHLSIDNTLHRKYKICFTAC